MLLFSSQFFFKENIICMEPLSLPIFINKNQAHFILKLFTHRSWLQYSDKSDIKLLTRIPLPYLTFFQDRKSCDDQNYKNEIM